MAFHDSAMDFGDHGLGIRSIALELGNDGADIPTAVVNDSMRARKGGDDSPGALDAKVRYWLHFHPRSQTWRRESRQG